MSLETLQRAEIQREGLGSGLSAPICKLLGQQQVEMHPGAFNDLGIRMNHQRGPAMSNAPAVPQCAQEPLEQNTHLSLNGRSTGAVPLCSQGSTGGQWVPWLLCRGTQGKEQQVERGTGWRTTQSLWQPAAHSGWREAAKVSPAGAQPPTASRTALGQWVDEGQGQGLAPWSQAGLRLLSGPCAVVHGRGSPPALLSIPALTSIPVPIPVLPGSSTGPTARWRSCNLLPVPRAQPG